MGVIKFNGITSKDLGVEVETFPDYVAPEKEYQVTHIPGRNGDLVVDTKTFQNVLKSYEVSVATNGVPIEVVNAAVARFKSGSRMPIKSLSSEIVAVQDLHGYDKPWVGGAGKNKLNISVENAQVRSTNGTWNRDVYTYRGVTFAFAKDNGGNVISITANGTPTGGNAILKIDVSLDSVYYRINGCSGGSRNTYEFQLCKDDGSSVLSNYNGEEGITSEQATNTKQIQIIIRQGYTANNLVFKPMIRLASETDATFEPYSNICPITGFTEANIVNTQIEEIRELFTIDPSFRGRVNFNQLAKQLSTQNGYSLDHASGNINDGIANVIANASQARVVNSAIMDYKKEHKYFVSLDCEFSRYTTIQFQLSLGGSLYSLTNLGTANQTAKKLSGIVTDNRGTEGTRWGGFSFMQAQSGDTGKMSEFQIIDLTQLFGETIADYIYNLEQSQAGAGVDFFKAIYPQEYYPYNVGQDKIVEDITPVTVNFGQTVYGGNLNVTTGELTITHEFITLDGRQPISFTNWKPRANSTGWIYPYNLTNNKVVSDHVKPNLISNCLETKSYSSLYNDDISGIGCYMDAQLGLIVRVNDATLTNATAINAYLANNPIQVCYELATPTVIQLTPTEVKTLRGKNNIFSDCGDVSVKVDPSFSTIINQVAEWLHSASGYARLEDTYEPDYYRMAYYSESLSVENLFNEAGKATLNFICKPQRYLKSGETPIVFTEEGTIQNGTRFSSSPVLKVITDNTQGSISIGNHTIAIKAGAGTDQITIDCELQDAWSGTTNKNPFIVLTDGEFPVIDPGTQTITFDGGVQSVEVTPRWWTV